MGKFEVSMKDGHLVVDVDLVACDFTAVDSVAVYPTEQALEEEMEIDADVRFVVDISGARKRAE